MECHLSTLNDTKQKLKKLDQGSEVSEFHLVFTTTVREANNVDGEENGGKRT